VFVTASHPNHGIIAFLPLASWNLSRIFCFGRTLKLLALGPNPGADPLSFNWINIRDFNWKGIIDFCRKSEHHFSIFLCFVLPRKKMVNGLSQKLYLKKMVRYLLVWTLPKPYSHKEKKS